MMLMIYNSFRKHIMTEQDFKDPIGPKGILVLRVNQGVLGGQQADEFLILHF